MINSFQFPRHLGTAITSSRVDLTVCCVFVHPERWTGANNAWEYYHGVQINVNACDCLPIHEGCAKSDIESIIMTLRGRKTTTNAPQPRVRRLPREEFNPKPHRQVEPQSVPRNRTRNRVQSAPGSRRKKSACTALDLMFDASAEPPRLPGLHTETLFKSTLRALLSGTFLQTLPDLVTPLKGHSSSPRSCPPTRSAPSERFGY